MIKVENDRKRLAFNAAVNILAVEFLVKTDDRESYSKYINALNTFDEIDFEILYVSLSLNSHLNNLGEMITQEDYDYQKESLFTMLNEQMHHLKEK